jgi:hypothetical protein
MVNGWLRKWLVNVVPVVVSVQMCLTRDSWSEPAEEAAAPPAGITAKATRTSRDKTSRRRNITDLPARTLHFGS